jgi:kynurenine 3-monooxygenase
MSQRSVAIVGGGPVGALAALLFSKHFSRVTLYELRPGKPSMPRQTDPPADPRILENKAALPNKSINLALSDRGITALQGVSEGLAAEVVGQTIPMRGRCLHNRKGNQVTQFYDVYRRV